jgi:uncharacterized protein involved in exopolysaccharide biosynthesis/Mrp family chromosome partitioning ATPase
MTSFEKIRQAAIQIDAPRRPEASDDIVDLFAVVRLVRRRIAIIVCVTLLIILAAIPLILSIEHTYYGESRILLQPALADVDPERESRVDIGTEVERLWSRDIATRVIEELRLDQRPEFNPDLRTPTFIDEAKAYLRSLFAGSGAAGPDIAPAEHIIQQYYGHLSVRRAGTSQVVQIGFLSSDPVLAATVPNTILTVYNAQTRERLRERVQAADAVLLGQIAEQNKRVAEATDAVRAFSTEEEAVLGQGAELLETVKTLSGKRSDILRERAELQARLAAAESASGGLGAGDVSLEDGGSQALDAPLLSEMWRNLNKKRFELNELRAAYGNSHARVVAAQSAVAEIEASIATEVERQTASLKRRLASLDSADAAVAAALDGARSKLIEVRQSEARLDSLEKEAARQRESVDALEDQRRAVVARINAPPIEYEVLSPSTVPLGPQGHGRVIYLLGASLAAVMIAFTIAVVLEVTDGSVRSPRQLSGSARVAPSISVPVVSRRVASGVAANRSGLTDPGLREAMRSLMLRLESSSLRGAPRSIAVTSAMPGSGVSVIASALATELANAGQQVLLVEIGWRPRRKRLDGGASGPQGLGKAVDNGVPLDTMMRYEHDGLVAVLPWGDVENSAFDDRDLIEDVLAYGASEKRFVIFDCPAALVATEALLVAARTDRTLLVLKWGATTRRQADAAFDRLAEVAQDRIFLSVNMVRPQRQALYGFPDSGMMPARRVQHARSRRA